MNPTLHEKLVREWGIALTGGVATGKSTVKKLLETLGFSVFDADDFARQALVDSHTFQKVVEEFGTQILSPEGEIMRRELGKIVFSDSQKKKTLESILHPAIGGLLQVHLEQKGLVSSPTLWFYEASLIFETKQEHRFKEVWVTYCLDKIQKDRLMARNQLTDNEAQKIIQAQWPQALKISKADFAINTENSPEDIYSILKNRLKITLPPT